MEEKLQAFESRPERFAGEFEAIFRLIGEGPLNESSAENGKGAISRLLTLCSLMRGTDTLKAYVRELLMTGMLTGFPQHLLVCVGKGEFGVFDLPVAREFERLQILVNQPVAMRIALAAGEKKKARKLHRRLVRWREQFEKLYGEPVGKGIDMSVLQKQLERF
ncbi:MAG: hypothetical protein KGH56_02910 [Patescibacteria group bacterium]|nr:hypothetical protein [Patescibacteria group bacterium]